MQLIKKFIILTVFVFLSSYSSQAIAGDYEDNQAIDHYNQGVTYHKQGRIDVAVTEYKQAIAYNPNLSEAHYNLGLIYADKKDYTDAKIMFKRVTELEPYKYEAQYNLGIMYSETGATESAILAFERAVSLSPDNEDARLALGAIYAKNNQDTKAIAELRQAYRINPYNADVKKVLDEYDSQSQRTATNYYRRSSSTSSTKSSDSPWSWLWILVWVGIFAWKGILKLLLAIFSRIAYELKQVWGRFKNPFNRARRLLLNAEKKKEAGDFKKAQSLSGEALKLLTSPEVVLRSKHIKDSVVNKLFYDLQIWACHLYAKSAYLGKNVNIEDILDKFKKVVTWDHSLLYLLGELTYAKNDFRKSFEYFSKRAASDKNNALVNLWLGILNYKLKNFKESFPLFESVNFPIQKKDIKERCLFDDPNTLSSDYLKFKGLSAYACQKWSCVIECFELLKKDYTIDNDLKFYLSRAYLKAGNYSEALRVINECINLEPNDPDLLIERAKIYKLSDRLQDADSDLKKALSISSEDHRVYFELALICSLQNKPNDALVCLGKAIQIKPDDFRSHYNKGMLYEKGNIYDKAIDSYLSAVKIDENNPFPNTRIGISYCKQGKYTDALPYFEKAIALGDNSNQALYFSGLAYANTENYSKGVSKWVELSENIKSDPTGSTRYIIARVDKNGRRLDSRVASVPKTSGANLSIGPLSEDIAKLKDLSVNREKYLFRELEQETKKQNWHKAYSLLNDIKRTATDRSVVFNIVSYVRNRLFPDFLHSNKRSELSGMLKNGLRENPTNYNLLHNISVLYYWWTINAEQNNSKDIQDYKLWDNLIGYWTAIVNNDEFWEKWAKRKPWIKNKDDLDLSKIRNNLMSHLETRILSSSEKDRQQNDDASLAKHGSNLKKLHIEKKFVTYYKELKSILSNDVAAIPDMYSETLIRDLDMQNYIIELSDLAIQKDPHNEKINRIKYYLSPYRYIAILVEDENYEHAIKELEALPSNCKNDSIVCGLMNISKLKLGASYLQNDNITNHMARTEKLWNECQIMNNELSNSIIESAALGAMKKFKAEGKIDIGICAGELALKFDRDCNDVKGFLSILFNDRGVSKWNSGLTDFSVNGGIYDMEKALEFNSDNVRAKKNLSIMYSLLGWKHIRQKDRNNDSIPEMFNKALELDKDNEDAKKGFSIYWNDLGIAYGNTDDKETVTKCFILALQYAPLEKTIIGNLRRVNYSKYQEHVNALKEYGIDIEKEDEE